MAKLEEPVGYVIMENDNTFNEVKNLQPIHNGILTYVRFDTILQSLDCVNRNRRYYKKDAMIESLSDPKITELIRNNKFKGEAGHPVGQPLARIGTVQPGNTCHRVIKWWIDGNLIRGTVETLDDGEGCPGTKLTRAILQNENPSFSYRGMAPITKKGNISYVNSKPTTIAYDEVNLPSHYEAYADAAKTIVNKEVGAGERTQNMTTQMVATTESVDSNILFADKTIAIYEKDIVTMMYEGSDNVKSICESFDIDPANLSMYGNKGAVQLKNGSDRIVIATERDLAKRVSNMWRGL